MQQTPDRINPEGALSLVRYIKSFLYQELAKLISSCSCSCNVSVAFKHFQEDNFCSHNKLIFFFFFFITLLRLETYIEIFYVFKDECKPNYLKCSWTKITFLTITQRAQKNNKVFHKTYTSKKEKARKFAKLFL